MKPLPLKYTFAVGLVLLPLLTTFYLNTRSVSRSEQERFDSELRRLKQSDTALNQDVLEVRFRILTDYDALGEEMGRIHQMLRELGNIPSFAAPGDREKLARLREDFAGLMARKSELVEAFKSQNAVLNNSLQYFPVAVNELSRRVSSQEDSDGLEGILDKLTREILIYNLTANEDISPEIRTSIDRLRDWQTRHVEHRDAVFLDTLIAHAQSILTRKPKVDALTRDLVSSPTNRDWEKYYQTSARAFANATQTANRYRLLLYLFCVLLVGGIGYAVLALHTAHLKVQERTRALSAANGELHTEVAERKRAEESLRASLKELADLKFALDEHAIVAVTDQRGRITYANDKFCQVSKYRREELLGQDHRIVNSGYHSKNFMRDLWTTIANGKVWRGEIQNRAKGGAIYWVDTTIVPFLNGDHKPYQYVVIRADITERKTAEARLEQANRQLIEASRQAGMAEVATGVLHNVGNVLNSVNVASSFIADSLRKSKAVNLTKVVAMLREHQADLGAFLTGDPKGKQLPAYLTQLAEHLAGEQATVLKELAALQKNIEHIKDIVAMQQSYAKVSGVAEKVALTSLVEDALRMNSGALARHEVQLACQYEADLPEITVDKHKVLQILVNLVRNAKYACDESGRNDKRLSIRVTNGDDRVRIAVADNGVGIPAENLTRIFNHGFTTRKDGHGFGLHSGALAAKEMGGSLTAESAGPGRGARFTLELPLEPAGSVRPPVQAGGVA